MSRMESQVGSHFAPFFSVRRPGSREGALGGYSLAILFLVCLFGTFFFFPQFFRVRSSIYKLSCKEIRRKVETALADYQVNETTTIVQKGKPIDLDVLKARNYLGEVQYCPEGGTFQFGPQGEVLCTLHRPTPGSDEDAKNRK